ncbi:MAG: TatD family hydrolase [Clostridiales Family XIII bacterium]|jgi:TatD DNase family protein|nr:TatD family hydrolase [Clostridiales Family XIII bacterium]
MTATKLLFDSHAHINSDDYSASERAALMDRIEASPVAYVLDVGYDLPSARQAVADAEARPWCYAAVGVHPHDAQTLTPDALAELRCLATTYEKVVAIGEIGLDFYRDLSPRDVQRDAFRRQIALALELGLPVTIHDRDSAGETVAILQEEGALGSSDGRRPPGTKVLLHCFSGSAEQALEYIGLGATISVAGPVTYKNNKKTVRVAEQVPLASLVIETDAPYLTPEPLRGRPNESPNVELVARKIAELRGVPYEEVARVTCENARRFFGV